MFSLIKFVGCLWIVSLYVSASYAIVGYSCGHPSTSIEVIDLRSVPTCDLKPDNAEITPRRIQVVQRKSVLMVPVFSCLVESIEEIKYCGMSSHMSSLPYGLRSEVKLVSESECKRMHNDKTYVFEGQTPVTGLILNGTITASFVSRGGLDNSGSCSGENWVDSQYKIEYKSAIKSVALTITLQDRVVPYSSDESSMVLPSGIRCKLGDLKCVDPTMGYTFGRGLVPTSCGETSFDVLYEGIGNITKPIDSSSESPTILTINDLDLNLGVQLKKQTRVCGQLAFESEHPDLYVLPQEYGTFYFKKESVDPSNIKLFSYINSKLGTFELTLASKLTSLYDRVSLMYCEANRQNLLSVLTLARIAPEEFAYQYRGNKPGSTAMNAGEVVYVVDCAPVPVIINPRSDMCTEELPVLHDNSSWYLKPRSHILTRNPTIRVCGGIAPTMYEVDGKWVYTDGNVRESRNPLRLGVNLDKATHWEYGPLSKWIAMGIYNHDDLTRFEHRLLLPQTSQSLGRYLADRVTVANEGDSPYSMEKILDDKAYRNIVEKGWSKFWGGFTTFGTIMSTIIGFYWIVIVVKYLLNLAVNFTVVYNIAGWSWKLVFSVWSGLTKIFVSKEAQKWKSSAASAPAVKETKPWEREQLNPI